MNVYIVKEIGSGIVHGVYTNHRKALSCVEAVNREGHTAEIITTELNRRRYSEDPE